MFVPEVNNSSSKAMAKEQHKLKDTEHNKPVVKSEIGEYSEYIPAECTKKVNIAFLKTHKSGSCTMSNILQRFGLRNDLNFVLPKSEEFTDSFWIIRDSNLDQSSLIPVKPGQHYNLITTHTTYNKPAYDRVMPPDYVTISILREPEDNFVSSMFYFYPSQINMTKYPYIFDDFFSKPQTLAGQGEDFGLPPYTQGERDRALKLVKNLDQEFDFIMLLEYFDESLVYLRRRFCWDFRDILYMVHNKNTKRQNYALTSHNRQQLIQILAADYIFYEHFKRKFWKDLTKSGGDLFLEVHHLKIVLRSVKDFCEFGYLKSNEPLVVPASDWNEPFIINQSECLLMRMAEPEMVKNLMHRAWAKYQSKLGPVSRNFNENKNSNFSNLIG
ncbi:hypothetical protein SNE40_008383 [Patella caerulea]|uniref:Galactosylceramide sulfotransferase-like n=1 Tax=Patella caerulea TaxID=87958 RepID=A0AAN8PYW7_PATCE